MKTAFDNISGLLNRVPGINVSKYDIAFLNKSIQKRISKTDCKSAEEYYAYLDSNTKEGDICLNSLQISYSEFFRNPLTFALLERIILPSLVLKKKNNIRKEIRIWSAACAAGQEAYSLAMLLEEYKIGNSETVSYRIFATDQAESQINEAKKGIYSETALNSLSMKRAKQWFTKHLPAGRQNVDTFSVKPELKQNIDFSVFDLFSEQLSCPPASIFGDFDLVICSNLLFYFKPEYQKIIIEKATKSLAKGGFIIVGEAERDILINYNYHEVFQQSGIFRIGIKQQDN